MVMGLDVAHANENSRSPPAKVSLLTFVQSVSRARIREPKGDTQTWKIYRAPLSTVFPLTSALRNHFFEPG